MAECAAHAAGACFGRDGGALRRTRQGACRTGEKNFVILEKMEFPEPVIQLAIEPKTKQDQDKLSNGSVSYTHLWR